MLRRPFASFFFFFNDTATTEIYTLSLHDALPISQALKETSTMSSHSVHAPPPVPGNAASSADRKSTRLNSSHLVISYAVFCLKKKKKNHTEPPIVTHNIVFLDATCCH